MKNYDHLKEFLDNHGADDISAMVVAIRCFDDTPIFLTLEGERADVALLLAYAQARLTEVLNRRMEDVV